MGPDRNSRIAFAAFWIVIALCCWAGYQVVHAMGLSAGSKPPTPAATLRPAPTHIPGFSIASIFAPNPPSLRGYHPRQLRTLVATGDVIPARTVNYKMVEYNDFLYPFRRTAPQLRAGDITLINLESPLINGCPVTDSGMTFCGDPRAVQGLQYAGIDVACTANNHIGNYGEGGITETWQHLTAAGIKPCGYDRVAYVTVRGLRFAFLAYNAVGQRFDYQMAREAIRAARQKADLVVVSVHWGKEYVSVPAIAPGIADDDPVRIGHWLIDSGADLVIGNHPHHIQGVEWYHGHIITYAHGNFAFDQMFTIPDCPGDTNFVCSTREGVVGTYTFYGKRLVSVRYRPLVIYDWSQPRWASPQQAQVILNAMHRATIALAHRKP